MVQEPPWRCNKQIDPFGKLLCFRPPIRPLKDVSTFGNNGYVNIATNRP